MGRPKSDRSSVKIRPALTPEGQENQLIAMAMNEAMRQMQEGTASAQVITHFLKLGAYKERNRLEIAKLEEENKLLRAKTEALQAAQSDAEFYKEVISAFTTYQGREEYDESEDPDIQ